MCILSSLSVIRLYSNVFFSLVTCKTFSFFLLAVLDKLIESWFTLFATDYMSLDMRWAAFLLTWLLSSLAEVACFIIFQMIILFLFYLSSVGSELERPMIPKEFLCVWHIKLIWLLAVIHYHVCSHLWKYSSSLILEKL